MNSAGREWLHRVDSGPSPQPAPTARMRRFRLFTDIRGILFGTRGGWTSPPPPSDSLQASDFNHSRASFFLQV
jgi:hypothetical protein